MSWKGLRHKGREILFPEEWNAVVDALDELHAGMVILVDAFKPVSDRKSITASENTEGLELVLKTDGRPNLNVYYDLGGPGEVRVEVSTDGSTWREIDVITLEAAAKDVVIYTGVAYHYVRVRVPTTGIDVELEAVASR